MNIRLSTRDDRDAILALIARMGFNPRDAVTWDGLHMLAMTAWLDGHLIGAIPMEPRWLRISPDRVVRSLHETVVAVVPEHRGSGLGSRLQQAIFEQRPEDAEIVTVFREDPQSPAYHWYLKNRFSPVMEIESWFCDEPRELALRAAPRVWEAQDRSVPWDHIEHAWRSSSSTPGTIDRASRGLREWLAVHPYRKRYSFHLALDEAGGCAVIGVGTMHSETVRADVLELMPQSADPSAAESLIRAIATAAAQRNWRPLRLPLAKTDPRVALLQTLRFRPGWPFHMLARRLSDIVLDPAPLASWRYGGIDYA